MKKRILSLLCVLTLCLTLLPTAALADDTYEVWVAGTQVTSANASDVLGDGKVAYNADTNTLTLTNATINYNRRYANLYLSAIYAEGALTIALSGTNTVTAEYNKDDPYAAIYVGGNLTISKADSAATATLTAVDNSYGFGINVTGSVAVGDNVTLNAVVGNLTGDTEKYTAYGEAKINVSLPLKQSSFSVTVPAGATLVNNGTINLGSDGTLINNGTVVNNGSVSALEADDLSTLELGTFVNNGVLYVPRNATASGIKSLGLTGLGMVSSGSYNSSAVWKVKQAYDNSGNAVTAYAVVVGGVTVTSGNASNVLGDGTVSYDRSSKTLTLTNANIETAANCGIYADEALTVSLRGTSSVKAVGYPGVYAESGSLTINSADVNNKGTLKVVSMASTYMPYGVAATELGQTVTIENCVLDIESNEDGIFNYYSFYSTDTTKTNPIKITNSEVVINAPEYGIYAGGQIDITGSTVDVTARADFVDEDVNPAYGIVTEDNIINSEHYGYSINIKSSTVTVDADYYGIISNYGAISVTDNSTVVVRAGYTNYYGAGSSQVYAIYSFSSPGNNETVNTDMGITLKSSAVTIESDGCGICTEGGSLTVEGGNINVTSEQNAISADDNITIKGTSSKNVELKITSGNNGIYGETVAVEYGNVTITADSDGIYGKTVAVNYGNVTITADEIGICAHQASSEGGIYGEENTITLKNSTVNITAKYALEPHYGHVLVQDGKLSVNTDGGYILNDSMMERTEGQGEGAIKSATALKLGGNAELNITDTAMLNNQEMANDSNSCQARIEYYGANNVISGGSLDLSNWDVSYTDSSTTPSTTVYESPIIADTTTDTNTTPALTNKATIYVKNTNYKAVIEGDTINNISAQTGFTNSNSEPVGSVEADKPTISGTVSNKSWDFTYLSSNKSNSTSTEEVQWSWDNTSKTLTLGDGIYIDSDVTLPAGATLVLKGSATITGDLVLYGVKTTDVTEGTGTTVTIKKDDNTSNDASLTVDEIKEVDQKLSGGTVYSTVTTLDLTLNNVTVETNDDVTVDTLKLTSSKLKAGGNVITTGTSGSTITMDNSSSIYTYWYVVSWSSDGLSSLKTDSVNYLPTGYTLYTCDFDEVKNGQTVCGTELSDNPSDLGTPLAASDFTLEAHSYSDTWTYDSREHWYKCTTCGDRKDVAEHTWTDSTGSDGKTYQKCSTCGYTKSTGITLSATAYTITIENDTGGTITAAPTGAYGSDTVTLTVTADSGYTANAPTVTGKDGNAVTVTAGETSGTYTFTMPAANVTVTGSWTSQSSGGGSGTGSDTTYTPTVEDTEGGDVSLDNTTPKAGDTVTITPTPEEGKTVDTVTVTDENGNEIPVTDNGDGTYSFTQPDGKVTVSVSFKDADSESCPAEKFTDVDLSQYYHEALDWAIENGITTGTSDTTFSPNASCTRAQAVTFIWRAAGEPEPTGTENPFTDVSADAYYYRAVLWAVENGVTTGTTKTTFSPDDTCTRAQIVTFLYRAAGSPAPETDGDSAFADVQPGAYYYNAVLWAVKNGVTTGTSATTFSPDDDCTRAQIVTFLYRNAAE